MAPSAPPLAGDAAEDLRPYLAPTEFIDCDEPSVLAFARTAVAGARDESERIRRLYYAVRDGIRYDPYSMSLDRAAFRASSVLAAGRGHCVAKATLCTAAARAIGVPARPGYADVRNHLCTPRLRAMMDTDLFVYHGYVELRLGDRWVKATPVFNLSLCEKFRVFPLEFDGRTDSLFHPYDPDGKRHMEYVRDHGAFADVPFATIVAALRQSYPRLLGLAPAGHDFEREAAATAAKAGRGPRRSDSTI
jgi:transglutaminase-like putative cysteine protease